MINLVFSAKHDTDNSISIIPQDKTPKNFQQLCKKHKPVIK